MKISKRDIQVLLGVLGVLMVVLAYQFGFVKLSESKEEMAAQNQELENQISELESLTSKKEKFVADTEEMHLEVEKIKDKFPANFKVEDGIMLTLDLEKKTGLKTTGVQVDTPIAVFEQGVGLLGEQGQVATDTTTEGEDVVSTGVILYNVPFTLSFEVNNSQLKDSLKFIQEYRDRKVIKSLSATYNSDTGKLTGSTNVNIYVITGTDKEYVAPSVPKVEQGTSNVFSTVEQ